MSRCEAPWHIENKKVDEAACIEALWHVENANSNMPGCVETPWHVEPSPFVVIHIENRRGGVEPPRSWRYASKTGEGLNPPHCRVHSNMWKGHQASTHVEDENAPNMIGFRAQSVRKGLGSNLPRWCSCTDMHHP
jgi:hypothetical protein